MRPLKIEIFNPEYKKIETVLAERFDSNNIMTIIYLSKEYKHSDIIRWIEEIDHWSILKDIVTIFYKNNFIVKVTRLHD
jgi:hypothetical protein